MRKLRNIILLLVMIPHLTYAEDLTKNAIQHDYELNVAYKNVMKTLNEEQKEKLRDAQRLWIRYRDASCDFENIALKDGHWIEEDISNSKSLECISRLSVIRTKELNRYSESKDRQTSPMQWKKYSFSFPQDVLSCKGEQLVRFSEKYKLYTGLTLCNETDEFRLYISRDLDGEYLPATDTGGHGQDHCELVNPTFTLPNTDNINSGGCKSCATSRNLPLEHMDVWARSNIGKPFKQVRSGTWSYQTSRLKCGVSFKQCFLANGTNCNGEIIN